MRKFAIVLLTTAIAFKTVSAEEDVTDNSGREDRVLSVFNVVTFPNAACGASNGYNGTCYTSSECTAKGGTASGTFSLFGDFTNSSNLTSCLLLWEEIMMERQHLKTQ